MAPRSDTAIPDSAFGRPAAVSDVPSMGSTAISQAGPRPLPTHSPLNNIGALSFSPSPITTTPSKSTVPKNARMASTAAASAASLSPRPIHGYARMAAASVARTNSIAIFRSGCTYSASASVIYSVSFDPTSLRSVLRSYPLEHKSESPDSSPAHDEQLSIPTRRAPSLTPHPQQHPLSTLNSTHSPPTTQPRPPSLDSIRSLSISKEQPCPSPPLSGTPKCLTPPKPQDSQFPRSMCQAPKHSMPCCRG